LAREDVVIGIGDDAAVLAVPAGMQLVISTDTFTAGVHFPEQTDPASIGHKALAVNLSDLAAMGALPAWFTLNLSLPTVDPAWLTAFCEGLFALANKHRVQLIGGDTTRGPLSITITVHGLVPAGEALLRSGAKPGDQVYVTGRLGEAGMGLLYLQGKLPLPEEHRAPMVDRLNRPLPRVQAGLLLRGLASACIDVSDGLLADLGHILEASRVGATVILENLPLTPAYRFSFNQLGWDTALAHGDDYELCFTLPETKKSALQNILPQLAVSASLIGRIEAQPGLRLRDSAGALYRPATGGYDHFAG
jgi:thiamine-monophosphate kinase